MINKKKEKIVEKVNNQTKTEYRNRIKMSYELGEEYYRDLKKKQQ